MSPIEVRAEIPAPVDAVWKRLADVSRHADWMSDASSIEFVGDSRSGVGTTIRVLTKVGPFRVDDVMTFSAWEPPDRMAVVHVGRVRGTGEFVLRKLGRATEISWLESLDFPWYMGGPVTAMLARPILRRVFQANLARFAAQFVPGAGITNR